MSVRSVIVSFLVVFLRCCKSLSFIGIELYRPISCSALKWRQDIWRKHPLLNGLTAAVKTMMVAGMRLSLLLLTATKTQPAPV